MNLSLLHLRYAPTTITVARASEFWFAEAEHFPYLADPDELDGRQRWPDRNLVRWHVLARILSQVSESLRARQPVDVTDAAPGDGLTFAEMTILEGWLSVSGAPRSLSPGSALSDGRRRLWNVWKHDPDASLPVRIAPHD